MSESGKIVSKFNSTVDAILNPLKYFKEQSDLSPGELVRDCRPQLTTEVTKPSFDFVRKLAINKLQCDVFRKLHIIFNSNRCDIDDELGPADVPNRLYSWALKDFTQRRNENYIWLDVLKKEIPANCLQILKFKNDLIELLRYLDSMLNGFTGDDKLTKIRKDIVSPIREASKFLNIQTKLREELEKNRNLYFEKINQHTALTISRGDPVQEALKLELEEKLMNNDVWDPIEVRYQLNQYRSQVNQTFYGFEKEEDRLDQGIKSVLHMQQTESYCSQCVLNMYYAQIENFKIRINNYNALYDKEYEVIDNKISYKKLSMDKIRDQRKFCIDRLLHFQEDLETIRLLEIAELEAEERRILADLEAKSAKSTKKGGKSDKRKKPKKK